MTTSHPLGNQILSNTLRESGRALEAKLSDEKQVNQNNFDSGLPLEDIFRETLSNLLPPQYSVDKGTIVDSEGESSGECDVVIYDRNLFPLLRPPATASSTRKFIPFESVYCIIEVKQNLTLGILDKYYTVKAKPSGTAFDIYQKIAKFRSLTRSPVYAYNPDQSGIPRFLNRPFAYAYAYHADQDDIEDNFPREHRLGLLTRFSLSELPDAIYINNRSSLHYGSHKSNELKTTIPEQSDSVHWIQTKESTFELFFRRLWSTLISTKLRAPDIKTQYGGEELSERYRCGVSDHPYSILNLDVLTQIFGNPSKK